MAVRQAQVGVYDSMQRPWRVLLADQLVLPADNLGLRHLHLCSFTSCLQLCPYHSLLARLHDVRN